MNVNAYNTTTGKPFRLTDHIESTIKTLQLTNGLTKTTKDKVYVIQQDTNLNLPVFAFPLSLPSHTREMITVYDERPFRNKSNVLVNEPEAIIHQLCSFLQQDVVQGNTTPLKNGRLVCTKAFANSLGYLLTQRSNLDVSESITLKILLSYYFVCLMETRLTDVQFVATNVIRGVYGLEKTTIDNVISDLPLLKDLKGLLDVIHHMPALYKLKTMTLKDFLTIVGRMSFSALGQHIVASAAEAPCLFMAMVYGTIKNKIYAKTTLGIQLDPKYNKGSLESFIKGIEFTYDLKAR